MPYTLNEKLRGLVPYAPEQGDYPVRLDANESFLPLPEALKRELCAALAETPFNRYPDPLAAECCTAFGAYYGVDPALVTAGNGSDELISVITGAFTLRGETVVTVTPDFSMYPFYGALSECRVVSLPKGDGLAVDPDALIGAANRERAAMVIFSNPCNPTSLGLTRVDVRRIIRGVPGLVALDEAYMDFWDQSLLAEAGEYENLIILRTCSKMMGMAAVRLGFAVANPTLTAALRAAKSPYNVNALTQRAGAVLLSQKELLQGAAAEIIASRDRLYAALRGLEQFPGASVLQPRTNFVLLRTPQASAVSQCLRERGILVRCLGDCLRITAGTGKENEILQENIYNIFKNMV